MALLYHYYTIITSVFFPIIFLGQFFFYYITIYFIISIFSNYFLLYQGFAFQFTGAAGRRQLEFSSFVLSDDWQVSMGVARGEALWTTG